MPDIHVPGGGWLNVNTASGIAVGSPLIIQNKSPLPVLVQELASMPPLGDTQGWLLEPGKDVELDAGSLTAWAYSAVAPAVLFVQEG